jgi:hypothetical protein
MDNSTDSIDSTTSASDIPPGYSIGEMPNGHHYLVPHFMIHATDLAIETQSQMELINIKEARGGVCGLFHFSIAGQCQY